MRASVQIDTSEINKPKQWIENSERELVSARYLGKEESS
jgi:hypothetical protein